MFNLVQKKLFCELSQVKYPQEFKAEMDELLKDYNNLMDYILFPQIFAEIIKKYKITCKYLKLIIIDSGDELVEYLLAILIPYMNYLTIVTDRSEYFTPLIDWVYEEEGLTIELIKPPLKEEIQGQLIIDMKRNDFRYYVFFEKSAVILDMAYSKEKHSYLEQRRKDLIIIYNLKVLKDGKIIDKEQIGYQLWKANWTIKRLESRQYIRKLEDKIQIIVLENKLDIQMC